MNVTKELMYAIIDIETTGGKFNEEGITEVAIYRFDGHTIVDQFISLVNPERPIQPFVVNLTGISDKMVRTAPKFHEVAKRIIEITKDCIFIAHNTSFDYRIIRTEYARLGYDYIRKTLCTVELSKELIPDMPSYSLGKLCKSLAIPMNDRHRASGDAMATVKLFKLLLDKDIERKITISSIKTPIDKEVVLPSKIVQHIHDAPSFTGLFFIHNKQGEVLYVGKNKNIQKGINQLFLRTSKRTKTLLRLTHSIKTENTGNELIADLKFIEAIHIHSPKFNVKKKKNISTVVFNNDNMMLINAGRHVNEKSVLLIEENSIKGSAFLDLELPLENIDIVKNLISPIIDNLATRSVTKKFLERNKIGKIIRF